MNYHKKIIASFFLILTLASGVSASRKEEDNPQRASIVIDVKSGDILAAENHDAPCYPASLTKMMTLLLLFDGIEKGKLLLNDKFIVSKNASDKQGSILNFKPRDEISVEDAILALAVKSANDVAVVVAEGIEGSESAFATTMTKKAKELGMKNTTFKNASGWFNTEHKSTAQDMAILLRALYETYPQYYEYLGRKTFTFKGVEYENGNNLLGKYPGLDGSKTGFIAKSGYCIAASAQRRGSRLIVVVLGENSSSDRDQHVTKLLDSGFNQKE